MDPLVEAVGRDRDAGSWRNPVGGGSAKSAGEDHPLGAGFGGGEKASDDSEGGSDAATLARGCPGGLYERGEVDLDEPVDPLGGGGGGSAFCHFGSDDSSVSHAERGEGAVGGHGGIFKKTSDSSCGILSVDPGGGGICGRFDSCGGCESSPARGAEKSSG